jgi:hypothetical protein
MATGVRDQGPGVRDQGSGTKKSGMDNLFLKSVYCLSGLGIVKKTDAFRNISRTDIVRSKPNLFFYIAFCFFSTIL